MTSVITLLVMMWTALSVYLTSIFSILIFFALLLVPGAIPIFLIVKLIRKYLLKKGNK